MNRGIPVGALLEIAGERETGAGVVAELGAERAEAEERELAGGARVERVALGDLLSVPAASAAALKVRPPRGFP